MSKDPIRSITSITPQVIRDWSEPRPILALTAYDYPVARLLDECGVDILHVGDSLGMVVMGYQDTVDVTMDQMCHHTEAVARAAESALVTADLSYASYKDAEQAVKNARRLRDAGAQAVKMEGGEGISLQIEAVLAEGIPVQGHLGMLPQSIRQEGRYNRKGRSAEEIEKLKRDALHLQKLGVFSLVLEAVVHQVAGQMTRLLDIPTIGIGSGLETTGQIQVIHDVMGLYPWFVPPFAQQKANLAELFRQAISKLKVDLDSSA
ncbi:MAG: 3-methyl-2-oxobutanoate hydroxymethyltransferase [Verrucomicrobiota bacterium]